MEIIKKNQLLDTLLFETASIFEKYNVQWWLECGTLLGMARQSDYLEWEDDIDLGGWSSSLDILRRPDLVADFARVGIRLVIQDYTATMWKGEHVYLDINFYRIEGDYLIMDRWLPNFSLAVLVKVMHRVACSPKYYDYSWSFKKKNVAINLSKLICQFIPPTWIVKVLEFFLPKCQNYSPWRVPKKFFNEEFKSVIFRGLSVLVPPDYHGYLSYRYGDNWHVPNKDWDTETQDATIV